MIYNNINRLFIITLGFLMFAGHLVGMERPLNPGEAPKPQMAGSSKPNKNDVQAENQPQNPDNGQQPDKKWTIGDYIRYINRAIQRGDLQRVQKALNLLGITPGPRMTSLALNDLSKDGFTLLHIAAYNGQAHIVQELLGRGDDIYAKTPQGSTALSFAVQRGHEEVVRVLMGARPQPNLNIFIDGVTVLEEAVSSGRTNIVRLLIADPLNIYDSSDWGFTLLHRAAQNGHVAIVRDLLATRVIPVDAQTSDGSTALHYAVQNEDILVVMELLRAGAKVDAQTVHGITPLHDAVSRGYTNIARMLIAAGADVNVRNLEDGRPLHYAATYGRHEIAEALVAMGAEKDVLDENDQTPYDLAIAFRHIRVAQLLAGNANPGVPGHRAPSPANFNEIGRSIFP